MEEHYRGHLGAHRHRAPLPLEEATRLELARRAEYEARPDVIAKRAADAEAIKRMAAEKRAKRKRPGIIQTTDYPWLKPDWVEPPVKFRR